MTFRVEMMPTAEEDADAILEWLILQGAGDTGLRWFSALQDAIASLGEFPQRCGLAPENSVFFVEVRQLLYGSPPHVYRVLFTIQGRTVYILHIRHGRRQPLKH